MGRITYDRAGRMSAQLMRPGRRYMVASGVSLIAGNASGEETRAAVDGFIAYFGTFDVNETTRSAKSKSRVANDPPAGDDIQRTGFASPPAIARIEGH